MHRVLERELEQTSNDCAMISWAEPYLHIKWHLGASSRLAIIEMGRKLGRRAPPPFGEGVGSLSNTKSPRLRPTSMLSTILIHPPVWPQ